MPYRFFVVLFTVCLTGLAYGEATIYGKANVSFQHAEEGDTSTTELKSNASRLGVKGSEKINDTLEAIYKFEFQVEVDDGKDKNDQTFSQRNIYVGLKGDWGLVKAGKFDSPLKVAQKKIDLFNDLEGDIKNIITVNDNRPENSLSYTTPGSVGPFALSVAIVASEDEDLEDGVSASLAYEQNDLYLAIAADQNVEGEEIDVVRAVAQYTISNIQLGALVEQMKAGDADAVEGWMLSAKYKLGDLAIKGQLGQSDIHELEGQSLSLGADYKLSKKAKVFAYYTSLESDPLAPEDATDNQYLGVGVEVKF